MGKFPIADKAIFDVSICQKCKARNPKGADRCRKCDYTHLRPKKVKKKETK